MRGIRYGRMFRLPRSLSTPNRSWQGSEAFDIKAMRRWNLPETCGDKYSPKEGRRGRDRSIRPGLSCFADRRDNSGAGGRENTAQEFALENKNKFVRIGQSPVCIY